ncbi:division/cell wall cluster transcriptional repressor MraZ [Halochromatium salexigens]|uniref:Transcriptional regulator MraZ n=1 Tax=Halochromatium salexigens TaxID=49447 RepID=A0AAJ0UGJ9_HALSE|nr:division/cell wall cluster transcriptional repressor MraZ [Halochromatium salexigens]MBK5930906.1 cell division/cell wall cluster transcriptional repressor MraZ [Halochromatium salexigens]
MFRGTQFLSLDAKGRLAIPSRQRERLMQLCDSHLVITAHPQRCLLIYPEPGFAELERKLNAMPAHLEETTALQRLLIGYANDVDMDAQGRVLLTPAQREFAALEKRVALVGMVNRFELWDEAAWQATIKEAEGVDLARLANNPETASFSF